MQSLFKVFSIFVLVQLSATMLLQSLNVLVSSFLIVFFNNTRISILLVYPVYALTQVVVNAAVFLYNLYCHDESSFGHWYRSRSPWLKRILQLVFWSTLKFRLAVLLYMIMNLYSLGCTLFLLVILRRRDNNTNMPFIICLWHVSQLMYFISAFREVTERFLEFNEYMQCDDINPDQSSVRPSTNLELSTEPRLLHDVSERTFVCDHVDPEECSRCVCVICLESMQDQRVTVFNQCSHMLHSACWDLLQEKSISVRCPQCRVAVETIEV